MEEETGLGVEEFSEYSDVQEVGSRGKQLCTAENPCQYDPLEQPVLIGFMVRRPSANAWDHPDAMKDGECLEGCCTYWRCPNCNDRYRVEWPA